MFKHIVAGCDGSPEGKDAAALGAAVACAGGGSLSLVGVFPTSLFPVAQTSDRKTLRAQATRTLRRERDLFAPEALVHSVADGSVPRALRRQAERWHADLVIIGSTRSAAPGHAQIGRRGRQLLYDAPFALAIAARGLHDRDRRLRSIGVGYDGGPEAEAALGVAAGLAHATGAQLVVRRVVEDAVPALTGYEWLQTTDFDHSQVWEAARRSALADAEAAVSRFAVGADVSATLGDPGYELRALSDTVDLIVVGSRRWGPVARLVSGGVGETLVGQAGSSVLIVPRPASPQGRSTAGRGRDRRPAVA